MNQYHATECIFDLIAACGPQEFKEMVREVQAQANDWASHKNPSASTAFALMHLGIAGILTVECDGEFGITYDLTDYGYEIVAGCSERLRDYEAHRRTLPTRIKLSSATGLDDSSEQHHSESR